MPLPVLELVRMFPRLYGSSPSVELSFTSRCSCKSRAQATRSRTLSQRHRRSSVGNLRSLPANPARPAFFLLARGSLATPGPSLPCNCYASLSPARSLTYRQALTSDFQCGDFPACSRFSGRCIPREPFRLCLHNPLFSLMRCRGIDGDQFRSLVSLTWPGSTSIRSASQQPRDVRRLSGVNKHRFDHVGFSCSCGEQALLWRSGGRR
jgi:hypothetical protein